MEKIVKQALLYDFYGELLTQHQKQIYGDIIQNDLSASEVALEQGISRQSVHDMMKRCDKTLNVYEDKLHLVQKFLKTKEMIMKIHLYSKDILTTDEKEDIIDRIKQIETISNEILEEF